MLLPLFKVNSGTITINRWFYDPQNLSNGGLADVVCREACTHKRQRKRQSKTFAHMLFMIYFLFHERLWNNINFTSNFVTGYIKKKVYGILLLIFSAGITAVNAMA